MPAPREVFLMLLSNVRNNTERATNAYQEFGKHAEDAEIKEALEARAFASNQILAKLDECFRIIGEKPAKTSGQLQETFLEDFRQFASRVPGLVSRSERTKASDCSERVGGPLQSW